MVGLLTLPAMGNAAPTLVQDSPTGMYVLQSNGSTIKEVLGYIEKTGKYVFVYDQNVKTASPRALISLLRARASITCSANCATRQVLSIKSRASR